MPTCTSPAPKSGPSAGAQFRLLRHHHHVRTTTEYRRRTPPAGAEEERRYQQTRSVKEHAMFMTTPVTLMSNRVLTVLAAVAITALGVVSHPAPSTAKTSATAAPAAFTTEEVITQISGPDGVLRFEVAEDGTRFTWTGDPALTDGLPDRDATYITQGYIYPEGTLNGSNGVLADGSPEFPDKVLGQWSCYGWYVGAGK